MVRVTDCVKACVRLLISRELEFCIYLWAISRARLAPNAASRLGGCGPAKSKSRIWKGASEKVDVEAGGTEMKKKESQAIRRGISGGKWNTARKWVGKGAKGVGAGATW